MTHSENVTQTVTTRIQLHGFLQDYADFVTTNEGFETLVENVRTGFILGGATRMRDAMLAIACLRPDSGTAPDLFCVALVQNKTQNSLSKTQLRSRDFMMLVLSKAFPGREINYVVNPNRTNYIDWMKTCRHRRPLALGSTVSA